MRSVSVKVPASTSNLGSGFDTLGLAVKLHNVIHVAASAERGIRLDWELAEADRAWFDDALRTAASLFHRRTRTKRFGARVHLKASVPMARGLGASATIRVGFLMALDALAGTRLPRETLLELATELEGHPDNASPALYGGFTVSGRVDGAIRCLSFPVSAKLKCVTLSPRFGISTEAARQLLPKTYTKADTAHALNRSALVTAAFSSGNYEQLRGVFDDRVHQPYRERLLPELACVIRAGERAGALGGFLSGSGSSILCLTLSRAEAVARAMQKQLPDSEVRVLKVENSGARIL